MAAVAAAQSPPGDVLAELLDKMGARARDVVAYTAACKELFAGGARRRRALVFARHGLRVRLRGARAAIGERQLFVLRTTGRADLAPRGAAIDGITLRLERAPHGLQDLLAATQKALTAVEAQSLVAPRRVARVRQDVAHVGTLACLLAWRAGARERMRQQAAEAEEQQQQQPHWLPPMPPTPPQQRPAVSRGVQTEGVPSLGEVRQLVAAFRALADSANPSTRLCEASLNLLDFFLAREAPRAGGVGGGDGGGAWGGEGWEEAEAEDPLSDG
ncbi:hypothetical protein Rsub_08489 [Raphidocelis subcapitata]|uniref:Uncharacterized protein n=1 Tax=Raphidocelis subcapitata TaxID=307507 RepID=A0A2V0P7R1_9CHLO|nr:hypothetical protein Rsub_08489 [Raphidocelis subcapitata]|eukprot:GBF95898.1 hypothetical protein Rsub_08489 [Raphidocelis subcapitata]